MLPDHNQRHIHTPSLPWMSDQPDIETSTWQHTALIRDKHPCAQRNSNPQSQQASGRGPTSYTAHHCFFMYNTGWGKIPSLLSVGHCERRGGRRRVGLGSKGAGSWEVPVTIFRRRKDCVVQRAVRICRRNLLFAMSLYRSSAACVPYSLPNPPSGPSTGPKIHCVVGWELQGNGKCVWKKMRTTTDLSNTREHRGCQTVCFAVSQAFCTRTPCKQRPPLTRYSF